MEFIHTTKQQKEEIDYHTRYLNKILCSCPDLQVTEDGIGGFTVSYNEPYLIKNKASKKNFITVFLCLLVTSEYNIPFVFCNDFKRKIAFSFAKNLYDNNLNVQAELIKFLKENLD